MSKEDLVRQIDAAIDAHAEWKLKLTSAINVGHCDLSAEEIACDDRCAFGKWLHGDDIPPDLRAGKPYQVTRRLHAEFHEAAGRVAALIETGSKGAAFAAMDSTYAVKSDKLTRALAKWRGELTG